MIMTRQSTIEKKKAATVHGQGRNRGEGRRPAPVATMVLAGFWLWLWQPLLLLLMQSQLSTLLLLPATTAASSLPLHRRRCRQGQQYIRLLRPERIDSAVLALANNYTITLARERAS